ncbi:MAG: hypothetical protein BWY77_01466 [bacterium ADurb.Bin431]|nr:MAG: hypothetical protein BWY77_01466 [bacterium ADurb.Bin431]
MGPLRLHSASGFASCSWASLDGAPLTEARYSLFTITTRTQNSGMIWEGTRTIHNSWGKAPTWIEPVRLGLTLTLRSDSIRVWPLDGSGARRGSGRKIVPASAGTFNLILDQSQDQTVWYGIEQLGALSGVSDRGEAVQPAALLLKQSHPNPFRVSTQGHTEITFRLGQPGEIRLVIYDLLGRQVRELAAGPAGAGETSMRWDGRDAGARPVAQGLYFYLLEYAEAGMRQHTAGKLLLLP